MKKFLVVFLALSLLGGAAFAEDLGLTAGLEFGIGVLNDDDVDAIDTGWVRPMLIWENDDLVENLELYAEIGVPFWHSNVQDEFGINLDFVLRGTYNLELSPEGTLGLILESSMFILPTDYQATPYPNSIVAPRGSLFRHLPSAGDTLDWALGFGARYTHALEGMSFFGQIAFPFNLVGVGDADTASPFDYVGFDFTAGFDMEMDFGLFGAELELLSDIRVMGGDGDVNMAKFLTLTPFVEAGPVYAEVAFGIPIDSDIRDEDGFSIVPEIRYQIQDNLQVYFNLPVWGIGSDAGDIFLGLGLGVLFRF